MADHRDLYEVGFRAIDFRLEDSHRQSYSRVLSHEVLDRETGRSTYRYTPIPADPSGAYAWLAERHAKIRFAHEILRPWCRVFLDVDVGADLLPLFRLEMVNHLEAVVLRVLARYYDGVGPQPECVWLEACRDEKISLHLIVKHAVFNHGDAKRRVQLEEFYRLCELEARHSGLFGDLPIERLIDHGPVSCVQFRMLGSMKRESRVPLQLLFPSQHELHDSLVCHWRREDNAEFFRHMRLNDAGRAVLAPPPAPALCLAKVKRNGSDFNDDRDGDEEGDERGLLSFVDEGQFEALAEPSGGYRLNRRAAGTCPVCQREHDRDNAFLFARAGGAYIYCHRAKKSALVGRVREPRPGEVSAWLEEARERDPRKVIPQPLPDALRYAERRMRFLDDAGRCDLVSSYMDTAKTGVGMIEYLLRYRPRRLLLLSPRIDYALTMHQRLKEAGILTMLYMHVADGPITADRVIISCESLFRIPASSRSGFTVFADECQSVLAQFNSRETMKENRARCYEALLDVLRQAERVRFMDAFVLPHTLDFLHAAGFANVRVVQNEWRPEPRIAVDRKDWMGLVATVFALLEQGKRLWIWSGSRTKAIELHAQIVKRFPCLRTALYKGQSGDGKKAELRDVDRAWSALDVVLATPCITVGISFNVPDHFDHLVVYATSRSCLIRDVFQAMLRVRRYRSGVMYYALNDRRPYDAKEPLDDTVHGVQRRLRWGGEADGRVLLEMGLEPLWDEIPPAVLLNHVHNRLEEGVTRLHFRAVWDAYLRHCGFVSPGRGDDVVEQPVADPSPAELIEVDAPTLRYKDIPVTHDLTGLERRIRTRTASELDKAMYDKHVFSTYVDGASVEELKALIYDEVWQDRTRRDVVKNLSRYKRDPDPVRAMHEEMARERYRELSDHATLRHLRVKELCALLGLAHPADERVIPRELLESLALDADQLRRDFGLRGGRGQGREGPAERNARLLTEVLKAWSGSRIKRGERRRQRQDNRFVDVSDFELKAIVSGIYEAIRK